MPIEISAMMITPTELATRLNISLVTILRALVASSCYVLPDQEMDQELVDLVLTNLGYGITSSTLFRHAPENRRMKSNWLAWYQNIQRRHLNSLYHFTAPTNIASIVRTGSLFARRQLAAQGIQPIRNSWGSTEKEIALGADYICLSLTKQWAMMRSVILERAELPAVLIIEPRVIWYEGTCFSPHNSARRDVRSAELRNWTTEYHFDLLFHETTSNWPGDPQAEILVRDTITSEDIRNIVFHDQGAFQAVWQDAGLDRSASALGKVRINARYFPAGEIEPRGGVLGWAASSEQAG